MTSPHADLDTLLREFYSLRPGVAAWHPTPEELVGYSEDRLPSEADEAVRDHLVACKECSALLLELEDLKSMPNTAAGGAVASFQAASAWKRQSALLADEVWRGVPRLPLWRLRALAAALAAVALGLGFALASSQRSLSELRAPQLDLPIVNLEPTGSTRSGEQAEVTLPEGEARWVLILNLVDTSDYAEYRLEFRTDDGRHVLTQGGLSKSARGHFRLSLPRDYLPHGRYRVELQGVRGGVAEPVAQYVLAIEEP